MPFQGKNFLQAPQNTFMDCRSPRTSETSPLEEQFSMKSDYHKRHFFSYNWEDFVEVIKITSIHGFKLPGKVQTLEFTHAASRTLDLCHLVPCAQMWLVTHRLHKSSTVPHLRWKGPPAWPQGSWTLRVERHVTLFGRRDLPPPPRPSPSPFLLVLPACLPTRRGLREGSARAAFGITGTAEALRIVGREKSLNCRS